MAEGDLVGHWVGRSGVKRHIELLCKSKVKANASGVDAEYPPYSIFRSFTYGGWFSLTFYLLQDHHTNICFSSKETALDLSRHVPCHFQCCTRLLTHLPWSFHNVGTPKLHGVGCTGAWYLMEDSSQYGIPMASQWPSSVETLCCLRWNYIMIYNYIMI